MSDLIHQMACAVNDQPFGHYLGDLIHDGLMLAQAKPGDSFHWCWTAGADGCGTHLWHVDRITLAELKRSTEKKLFYKVTVTGKSPIGYPEGTLEKLE